VTRILVTGSRDWSDRHLIAVAISKIHDDGHGITIVHGACPSGADALADEVAYGLGYTREPHPADWDRYKKRAGPIRNAEMVALGADCCLAFICPCRKEECTIRRVHGSHGTSHCLRLARKAGIETRVFYQRKGATL
jgi:YspA, cpYpsA-related SLOG family